MQASDPSAEPSADPAHLQELALNDYDGPAVEIPWSHRQETVDTALSNATQKLISAKTEKELPQAFKLPVWPNNTASNSRMSKTRRKRVTERATARADAMTQARKIFILQDEPRFQEMASFLAKTVDQAADPGEEGYSDMRISARREIPTNASWISELRSSIDALMTACNMALDPEMREEHLARTHEWFLMHRDGPQELRGKPVRARPSSTDLNFIEGDDVNKHRPGSAFHVPTDRYGDHHEEEVEAEKHTSSIVDDGSMASRLMNVQLPPARERLRNFQTKQLVSPLTARTLKAATSDDCQSPELIDRPFTPSTCTGGSHTARSISSARSTPTPLGPFSARSSSARSSPTPLGGSRPSSAVGSYQRPLTAQGRRPDSAVMRPDMQRPGTAPRMGTRPPTLPDGTAEGRSDSHLRGTATAERLWEPVVHEEVSREEAERHVARAMERMEERWVMRRHRDISNQMVDEERHAAIAIWAERRARVEEEITRNAEAIRFQSELSQRASYMPADAVEDIPATVPCDEELRKHSDSFTGLLGQGTSAAGQARHRGKPPLRHDVSKVVGDEQQSRSISEDAAKLDKIANLRRLNRHLLLASDGDEDDDDDLFDDDFVPDSIFQTEVNTTHISLSPYTADAIRPTAPFRNKDDADIVAEVCDQWSERETLGGVAMCVTYDNEAGTRKNLHELRFKQQQEAEVVKRVLARRNCPFNASVVDSALVMPSHVVKAAGAFNQEPNLNTPGLPSWFFQEQPKKRKPVKAKSKKKKS